MSLKWFFFLTFTLRVGASHSNNMRDSSYSLLRSTLELMVRISSPEVPDFAFMLSRVYLQLNINHTVKKTGV